MQVMKVIPTSVKVSEIPSPALVPVPQDVQHA